MDLARRVEREGVCLLRLCADLRRFIETGRSTRTYLDETDAFLDYISECLDKLEGFTKGIVEGGVEEPLIESRLRDFGHIKIVLSWLYSLSKEAIDADTLSIPFSLVTFLNYLARQLQDPADVDLVVMGSSELNYFKFNLKPQRDLSEHLATSVIPDYPRLSARIGILKFPYCASNEVLVNSDLFHELGHYIYETTALENTFFDQIEDRLVQFVVDNAIAETVEDITLLWPKLSIYVRSLLLNWADEIFADIFAIGTLGPAFHLGLLEIEQVVPLLSSADLADIAVLGETVSSMHQMIRLTFCRTHPAVDFRFKIHAQWLHDCGWDLVLSNRAPEVFAELERCKQLEASRFTIVCESPLSDNSDLEGALHKWMIETFMEMVPSIEDAVRHKIANMAKPIEDFERCDRGVTACLEHAVVPSTIITERQERLHPTPTTLLNSGFFFYFGGMTKLFERVKSSDEPTKKRMQYETRLNHWLGKAIDDWQIIRQERKA